MPSFLYNARDRSGAVQTGALDAVDENEVLAVLQNRGLIVTGVSKKDIQAKKKTAQRKLRGGIRSQDKVMMCQQLSALLEAGIPLLRALQVVSAQIESRPLLQAVDEMRQDIEAGKSFRDALAKHPKVFTKFWVNLVETGEASGHLGDSLKQLSEYLEAAEAIRGKAVTAMMYPAVLMIASIGAIVVFMLKVIPIFSKMFATMDMELPLLTRIIIAMSNGLQRYFIPIAAVVAALIWGVKRMAATERGKSLIDRVVLTVPVFAPLFVNLQLAQFARGLGTLLKSGVPILYGLEIMQSSAGNSVYAKAIADVKEYVREGKTMADPMEKTGLFPMMMVQMVRVGEEIGELGNMLNRVALYYEERVDEIVARMSVLFEPIAIMVMALVIGTLVVAMFMPIFSMSTGMKHG